MVAALGLTTASASELDVDGGVLHHWVAPGPDPVDPPESCRPRPHLPPQAQQPCPPPCEREGSTPRPPMCRPPGETIPPDPGPATSDPQDSGPRDLGTPTNGAPRPPAEQPSVTDTSTAPAGDEAPQRGPAPDVEAPATTTQAPDRPDAGVPPQD